MSDTAPALAAELAAELADDIAKGRRQRVRRRTVAALVVLAVAVVLGVLTVALDWGWFAWRLALALVAVALVVTSLRFGLVQRIAAVVTAVAVVAAGVLLVRIPPIAQAGWTVDEYVRLVAAAGDLAVTFDPGTGTFQGRATSGGDEVWKSESFGRSGVQAQQLGDAMLVYFGSKQQRGRAAIVSIADGKTSWKQDVGGQTPFTANDDVVVFTSNTTTTGLDLRTGSKIWSYAGGATAGSAGESSYLLHRWVPGSEWIAVDGPKSKGLPAAVLDVGTGQAAASVHTTSNDFTIAGQTFIAFGYDKQGNRVARGTPLAGGRTWSAEIPHSNVPEVLDVVDGKARALYSNQAVFITPETGALQQVPIKDDWSVAWFAWRVGGRYAVVEQRDRDRKVIAQSVADTVSGDVLKLTGQGRAVDLELAQFSTDKALLHTDVVDAVGGDCDRYTVIENDAGKVSISTRNADTFADEHVDWAGDVIQVNQQIIPLVGD